MSLGCVEFLAKTETKAGENSPDLKCIQFEPERQGADQGNEIEAEVKTSLVSGEKYKGASGTATIRHSLAVLRKMKL